MALLTKLIKVELPQLIKRKLIANYFDNWLIIKAKPVIFLDFYRSGKPSYLSLYYCTDIQSGAEGRQLKIGLLELTSTCYVLKASHQQ